MCGIAGIFAYSAGSPVDRLQLRTIRDYMASRGPDGQGEWFSADNRLALGHRRLAIIDLSDRGAQPMCSEDGRLVITYNGEIYNYRELRKELESRGCVFASDSDTEVLLHLYAEHGQDMLRHLRGMFAFALWDGRKQSLLLARDAFGIKPLYYARGPGVLRFASQVKALLAGGDIDTTPQPAGHAGFFLWGSVPAPWTLYRGIHALPAGHFMWVDAKGESQPVPYCRVTDILAEAVRQPAQGTVGDALEAIAAAVRDSIAAHHVADVPVGLFLSAGIDSALVAALSAARGEHPRTLTLAFSEYAGSDKDEAPLAQQLAAQLGTQHSEVTVSKADFEEQAAQLFAAMDQPSLDGVNSWFVAHAARSQDIKVALSGLGGDELFASYPSFSDAPRIRNVTRPFSVVPGAGRFIRQLTAPLLSRITSPKYASLLEYGPTLAGAYLLRRGLYMPWELPAVMDPAMARAGCAELCNDERLAATIDGVPHDRLAVSALELSWYMRNQLLPDTDWASMAHSLEVRVPFLDLPLLRTVAPWLAAFPSLKKRDIARHLAPDIPAAILRKPKTGFTVPVREWLGARVPVSSTRGLRGWAGIAYTRSMSRIPGAGRANSAQQPAVVALWSPEMATSGGVQNYMWRLWEMLAGAKGAAQPPRGLSLMDSPEALANWSNRINARPLGASESKVRFMRFALGPLGRAESAIVGHVHHAPVAWLAQMLGKIDRYIVVLHGIEAWQRLPLHRRVALKSAHAVVATTRYTASTCAEINRLPRDNFKVIPLCADPAPAAPEPGFTLEGGFAILFVGRLATGEKYKGLETLIEAVARLLERKVNATLHVIGDGNDRRRLQDLTRQYGVGHCIFFHGRVSDARLQAAYAGAHVFAMPSAKEGFGIVFLEAMRHGVACIGGAHGGTPEVFADGTEGFLVPYGDIEALAQRLEILADDPVTRHRVGQAGKRRFENDYSFPTFASRWEKLLLEAGPNPLRHSDQRK